MCSWDGPRHPPRDPERDKVVKLFSCLIEELITFIFPVQKRVMCYKGFRNGTKTLLRHQTQLEGTCRVKLVNLMATSSYY